MCAAITDKPRLPSRVVLSIMLALATLFAFLPVLDCGFINYDDPGFVYENPQVISNFSAENLRWAFLTTKTSNWHPLTWLSYMVDSQLYGRNPQGYHATNLLLHILTTLLLFLTLEHLTTQRMRSAFVAALFALHPLHVESVAWISERKDLLCALFFILTLYAYSHYAANHSRAAYLATLGAFTAGLMSKPMIVTLPVLLFILDWWPLERFHRESWQRLLFEKLPFLVLAALLAAFTVNIQQQSGALASVDVYPVSSRLNNAVYAYSQYIQKTFLPLDLAFFYPLPEHLPQWQIITGGVFLLAITAIAITQARKRSYLAAGWGWFMISLLPVIGLFQVGIQSHADRYTYLPLIGIFIMISWGAVEAFQGARGQRILLLAATTVICLFSILTFRQSARWKDSITLYNHTLSVTENNFTVHYNLGVELDRMGQFPQAATQFREVVRIAPEFILGHYNLGITLAKTGEINSAITHFREALRIDPQFEAAYRQLAYYLEQTGNIPQAVYYYGKLLQLDPGDGMARIGLKRLQEQL